MFLRSSNETDKFQLANEWGFMYNTLCAMAQWLSWLERRPVTAEVTGSSPVQVAYFMPVFALRNGA